MELVPWWQGFTAPGERAKKGETEVPVLKAVVTSTSSFHRLCKLFSWDTRSA